MFCLDARILDEFGPGGFCLLVFGEPAKNGWFMRSSDCYSSDLTQGRCGEPHLQHGGKWSKDLSHAAGPFATRTNKQ